MNYWKNTKNELPKIDEKIIYIPNENEIYVGRLRYIFYKEGTCPLYFTEDDLKNTSIYWQSISSHLPKF